jgi:phosphate starvation-inducible membrane PsiE
VAVLLSAGAHVPLIPFVDVVGKVDKLAPKQIGATALKVGITAGLTTIVKVVVFAHWPALGVKVYVVVAVLLSAGAHVPLIPFVEVVGKADNAAPEQIGAIGLNDGVTVGLTMIVKVVVAAHWPAAGVKVYVVVAVLLSAGAHVPLIPFVEVVGNADKAAPTQIGATGLNVGVTLGVTVIVTGVCVLQPKVAEPTVTV